MAAIAAERRLSIRPRPEKVTDAELRKFSTYARMLAARYPHPGEGVDERDVEQQAMVAAWEAIAQFKGNSRGRIVPFVQQRMRWRVIDFVRIRTRGERLEAERAPLPDEALLADLTDQEDE